MSEASNTAPVVEIKTAWGWKPVIEGISFGWASCWLTLEIYGCTHRGYWRCGDHVSAANGFLWT